MIDCQLPNNFFLNAGATIVEWSSEVYGWVGLPDDVKYKMQLEFPSGEELWIYESESTGRKFAFWWINFETGSMPDGSHNGNHNFCGLYEITKRKE